MTYLATIHHPPLRERVWLQMLSPIDDVRSSSISKRDGKEFIRKSINRSMEKFKLTGWYSTINTSEDLWRSTR
jgi:hypothetical protein